MDVDCACRLTRLDVVRLGQRFRTVVISGLILPSSIRNMYILFCVSIDTYIQGLVGWKSRWRGPKSFPPLGEIDTSLVSTPSL
jgi:hypothetical protein